jgi:alpha-beta hydrolase superfamily lysophospholipase
VTRAEFRFDSTADGFNLQAYRWSPATTPRAILVLAHGAAEHALRYERFITALNDVDIEVWAVDHRGYGQSVGPRGFGDLGEGGWEALVSDVAQLIEHARIARPHVPLALFGHSMGSFAAQQLILMQSKRIDGLILSGSAARAVTRGEASPATNVNAAFKPARTPYDWLSRDQVEVDAYIADPLCGFENQGGRATPRYASKRLADHAELTQIRPDLPMLFVAGDRDPINSKLEGLHLLERRYRDAGVQRIDTQYYEGGRHEMLNEINRDEVTANILAWLDDIIG